MKLYKGDIVHRLKDENDNEIDYKVHGITR